eukprot:3376994-Amphidinium_carterae.2
MPQGTCKVHAFCLRKNLTHQGTFNTPTMRRRTSSVPKKTPLEESGSRVRWLVPKQSPPSTILGLVVSTQVGLRKLEPRKFRSVSSAFFSSSEIL